MTKPADMLSGMPDGRSKRGGDIGAHPRAAGRACTRRLSRSKRGGDIGAHPLNYRTTKTTQTNQRRLNG